MTKVKAVAAAKYGVVIVPAVVWFMLFGVSLADAVFTYQRWRPIGDLAVSGGRAVWCDGGPLLHQAASLVRARVVRLARIELAASCSAGKRSIR